MKSLPRPVSKAIFSLHLWRPAASECTDITNDNNLRDDRVTDVTLRLQQIVGKTFREGSGVPRVSINASNSLSDERTRVSHTTSSSE